jgi:hypothetical protein
VGLEAKSENKRARHAAAHSIDADAHGSATVLGLTSDASR